MSQQPTGPNWPDFSKGHNGLLPVIAQDHITERVLMLAWMNEASLRETIDSGYVVYFSRSRQQRWKKGETSGHVQQLVSLHWDCDGDAILVRVKQTGPACHVGYRSCFFTTWSPDGPSRPESPIGDATTD